MSFNPMKVTLESKGKTWHPKGFYRYENLPKQRQWCSKGGKIQTASADIEIEVEIRGWDCFWLEFDRSSSPVDPFVLKIAGAKLNGKSVMIPPFKFQKGSTWQMFTVP